MGDGVRWWEMVGGTVLKTSRVIGFTSSNQTSGGAPRKSQPNMRTNSLLSKCGKVYLPRGTKRARGEVG